MQFTDEQKLIAAMLAEVHQKLGIEDGVNSKLVSEAIWSGNEWAIKWDVQLGWTGEEGNPPYVKHVLDVLDMWKFIEDGYADLDGNGKKLFAEGTGSSHAPRFAGFDGNNEADEYSAAKFMINKMGRFQSFAGRDLNSHSPSVERNERRLAVFAPIYKQLSYRNPCRLTVEELIAIVNA